MKLLLRVISVFLVFLVLTSLIGEVKIYADPIIYDLWIDASEANAVTYPNPRIPTDMVRWWKYRDNFYYLMLPNSANLAKLKVYYRASDAVKINGNNITSGAETSVFKNGGSFTVSCGSKNYTLIIMKASKIPSLFIATDSGSLSNIHANKSHQEKGMMLLVDENGKVVYNDDLDYIKGRGNATWVDHPKKPYNIRLAKSTDLLGMGKSKRWSLIANYGDKTHLHNKLAYEIAREVGIEFTANTRHVDLYINNEYMGLYVLTERNNVEENHVNITDLEEATEKANNVTDLSIYSRGGTNNYVKNSYKYYNIPKDPADITGGYLIEFELSGRYSQEPSGFVTSRGQAIVIKSPEHASKKQVEYIRSFFQDFEDAIYSSTGYNSKGKHYTEYVDLDSLVRMYVLHEFCLNLDVAICSFFFYKDSDKTGDGKLHAAPPWDFDNAFGAPGPRDGVNLQDPKVWWANAGRIHADPSWTPHLTNVAYRHKEFVQRAIRIWHTEFVPPINKIIDPDNTNPTKIVQKIEVYMDLIRDSAVMNNIFWYDSLNTIDQRVANLTGFMRERAAFLSQAWKTNINDLEVEYIDPVVYKGSPVKPKVVIKDMGDVLLEGHEYTVSYTNNNSVGKASVTITMQKYYTGSKTVNFTIVDESKAALVEAINKAKARNEKEYSKAEWNTLQTKLTAARNVCEKSNATKAEIDKAVKELNEALLAGKVDKSSLQNAINLADSKNANDYTADSWSNMQSKLNSAKSLYNSTTAKQSDIDKATTDLLNAINSLVPANNSEKTPTPGGNSPGNGTTATPGNSPGGSAANSPSSGGETAGKGGDDVQVRGNNSQLLTNILITILALVLMGGITLIIILKKKLDEGKGK